MSLAENLRRCSDSRMDSGEPTEPSQPHNQPAELEQKPRTRILAKSVAVAAASISGAVALRVFARQQSSGVALYDLAGLLGTAFVPFAGAMVVAVFVKGRAGIIVGLAIAAAILALMFMG